MENYDTSAYEFKEGGEKYALGNSQSKPRFQHNLLLPSRNEREFKKLFTGSKQKFLEMAKNKHRLDTINFKAARSTLGIPTIAEKILNNGIR